MLPWDLLNLRQMLLRLELWSQGHVPAGSFAVAVICDLIHFLFIDYALNYFVSLGPLR